MPTALLVIGTVIVVLGTWMLINEITTGKRTLYAGLLLQGLALLMILLRRKRGIR